MWDISAVFDAYTIPLGDWIQGAVDWLVFHFRWFFLVVSFYAPIKDRVVRLGPAIEGATQGYLIDKTTRLEVWELRLGEGCVDSLDGSTGRVRLTSDEERIRRLAALRNGMRREGLEALVVCGRNDATRLFEDVRQVKSAEEIANLRGTSAIFRKIFAGLEGELRPGISEADIAGGAARLAKLHGCRDVKTAMASTPFRAISYGSNKRIEVDDLVMVWIETPGPTGYWLELRRCYTFGPVPPDVGRFWAVIDEVWNAALNAIRPGVLASTVVAEASRVLAQAGYGLSEAGYALHGIGADAIEGMWIPGNDRVLKENEVVSLHPGITFASEQEARRLLFIGTTDNILVTPAGGERLTYPSDSIVAL